MHHRECIECPILKSLTFIHILREVLLPKTFENIKICNINKNFISKHWSFYEITISASVLSAEFASFSSDFVHFRTLWTSATPVLCHTFSWMKKRKRPIVTVCVPQYELWLAMATILSHLTRKAVSVHLIMHQINLFISLWKNYTTKKLKT